MSDFHQHGLISTLQQLGAGNIARLERELCEAGRAIALILPCHGRDLTGPALDGILEQLSGAAFLSEVIVSMNGLDADGHELAKHKFSRLPQRHRILWNDGPLLRPQYEQEGCFVSGKGFNVWAATQLLCKEANADLLVTQDCDVLSFRRETLVRLCYSGIRLGYEFSKMYYSRVTDRIYGRVGRLFLGPLLHALVRVSGHQPLLDFLLSFRYPLSGECAVRRELAAKLPFSMGWGLEIGMLCEVFRLVSPRKVCQVDGGSHYDHKHQPLTGPGGGLEVMAKEIARTLFAQLAIEGIQVNAQFLEAVRALYRVEAAEALIRYRNLALINDLPFDGELEELKTQLFASALEVVA